MKFKQNNRNLLMFILLLINITAYAQPLSGTYTVGGPSPDYISLNNAYGALQTNGISGPVIFNIRDGIYHEKVTMYQFVGSSMTNTVTFQSESGDSSLVIISDTASVSLLNYTIQIFGVDNLKFKQVTIQRPGNNANGTVVEIGNTSTNISLINNRIIGGTGSSASTSKSLIYTDSSAQNNNITLTGNLFLNGNFGVYKQSYTNEIGTTITNNIFQNQFTGAVYVYKQTGANISRNIITGSGSAGYRGLSLNNSMNDCVTNKNKIAINNGNAGIYYSACISNPGNENSASNNFIQMAGNTINSGINITNSQNIKIFHNSINLTGSNASSSSLLVSGTTSSGIQLMNNVFKNASGGFAINVPAASSLAVSDYNDFYTTGLNLGLLNALNAPALTDWIALSQMDSNSVNADPVFTSVTDLHASSLGINDLGTPLGSVSNDIDGESRSATNPDIGADEFTPLTDNISLTAIISPVDYACGDSNTTVRIVLQNFGLNAASAIPVTVEITGSNTLTLTDTVTGPLASYASDTLTFSDTWNNYSGGVFTVKSYCSYPGDQYLINDTLTESRTIIGIPALPTATSPQTFCEGDIQITAITDSGNVLYWYDQPSAGNLLFTGTPFSPALNNDTTFYVEAHSGTGSTGCLRITEMATESPSGNDHLEIQNLSSAPVDVTGWVVAVSDDYSNINLVNAIVWDLSSIGTFAAGQIAVRDDDFASPDYWGSNIFWSSGVGGWVIIIDNNGNVVDFAPWFWTSNDIQNFNVMINNFPVTIGGNWNGNGINGTCGDPFALSRVGNSDNDDANDFTCITSSKGASNPGLIIPFPNCGASACGSDRIPVNVTVNPNPVVNLGSDTTSGTPFTFDAGAGFSSYLWSTSATTQTIQVSTTGTYYVVVTDGNGCSGTDTVQFTSTVGINEINSLSNLLVFPNPANERISISFYSMHNHDFEIRFLNSLGEIVLLQRLNSFSGSFNKLFNVEKFAAGIYNLQIIADDGVFNRKITVE